jgi:hypothetical protein
VTIRTGAIDLGRRATSLNWWQTQSNAFDLFVSDEVVRELSDSAFPETVRRPALSMLRGLNVLDLDMTVPALAELLVREKVMPGPAVEGDAVHLAISVVHGMDYLLTWNQRHLANPNKRTHLAVICARMNLMVPQIVTPDLLIVEADND